MTVRSIFPDENTRVCLSPIRGIDGSDYINASYIDVSDSTLTLTLSRLVSGLSIQERVHRHAGPVERDGRRFLANGLGTQRADRRDVD